MPTTYNDALVPDWLTLLNFSQFGFKKVLSEKNVTYKTAQRTLYKPVVKH